MKAIFSSLIAAENANDVVYVLSLHELAKLASARTVLAAAARTLAATAYIRQSLATEFAT